ncbi:uncharacterized protein ZBIST_5123 [Zygosaccharomyces bailii]|nr:uncharacterized protein ZBIST_5123 [Zygosaccharomyces bailii]
MSKEERVGDKESFNNSSTPEETPEEDENHSYAESVQSYEAHGGAQENADPEGQGITSQMSRHLTNMLSDQDGTERLAAMSRVISTKTKKEMQSFEVDKLDFDLRSLLNYLRSHAIEQGIQPGDSGVAFKGITAVGVDASAAYGPSMEEMGRDFLKLPIRIYDFIARKKENIAHRNIIQNCTGVVESGEMLFVVGRPGAGCSTLLKSRNDAALQGLCHLLS